MRTRTLGHQVGYVIQQWLLGPAAPGVRDALTLPQRLELSRNLAHLLCPSGEPLFDWEDAWQVLRESRGLWLGRAQVAGAGRAPEAADRVWRQGLLLGPCPAPISRLLLVIRTAQLTDAELQELVHITEAVQQRAGVDCQMYFANDADERLDDQLEVLLLVGYQ